MRSHPLLSSLEHTEPGASCRGWAGLGSVDSKYLPCHSPKGPVCVPRGKVKVLGKRGWERSWAVSLAGVGMLGISARTRSQVC